MKNRGIFISFEGPEGSGKTTHSNLLRDFLIEKGYNVLKTREPGGVDIAEDIRNILLNPIYRDITPETELFLYMASRAQHVIKKIKPALEKGYIVICDRFIDASLAYQGYARGFGFEKVEALNSIATRGITPDLTFLLDIDVARGLRNARISKSEFLSANKGDRMEMEDILFHRKVYEGYKIIAKKYSNRIRVIKVFDNPIKEIQQKITDIVMSFFNEG